MFTACAGWRIQAEESNWFREPKNAKPDEAEAQRTARRLSNRPVVRWARVCHFRRLGFLHLAFGRRLQWFRRGSGESRISRKRRRGSLDHNPAQFIGCGQIFQTTQAEVFQENRRGAVK